MPSQATCGLQLVHSGSFLQQEALVVQGIQEIIKASNIQAQFLMEQEDIFMDLLLVQH